MSINITVHGNTVGRKMLGDHERCRREELKRRKLLRLEQVRQQSKEIAAQIRIRVGEERKRQIERIDQIKEDEVRAWKIKHLGLKDDQLADCVGRVGEAHAAAKEENECEKKRLEQQKLDRRVAAQRGREAMAKLEQEKRKKVKPGRVKPVVSVKRCAEKPTENVATQVGDSLMAVAECANELNLDCIQVRMPEQGNPIDLDNMSSDTMSSLIETTSKLMVAARPQISKELLRDFDPNPVDPRPHRNTDPATQNMAAHYDPEIQPTRISERIPENRTENSNANPLRENKQFSGVSEIVNRRRNTNSNIDIGTGVPVQSNAPIQTFASTKFTSGARFSSSPANPINPSIPHDNTASKSSPSKQRKISPTKRTAKQVVKPSPDTNAPQVKSTYVPRFTSSKSTKLRVDGHSFPIVQAQPKTKTLDPVIENRETVLPKVQYYDHANRFSKEYDLQEDLLVQRDAMDASQPNAMEAAAIERQLEVEQAKLQEQQRRQSESRSQHALERERVRKDYDLMNAQLEHLSKQREYAKTFAQPNYDFAEERLNQMAIERQKTMNKMVEEMLPAPVMITCPRVTKSSSADSSGLNVADVENLIGVVDMSEQSEETRRRVSADISEELRKEQRHSKTILGSSKELGNSKDKFPQSLGNANRPPNLDYEERNRKLQAEKRQENKENVDAHCMEVERKHIEKREEEVKYKERKIEQKLIEMFRANQKKGHAASVQVQTDPDNKNNILISKNPPEAPVQIIIQVHGGSKGRPTKSALRKTKSVPLNEEPKQVFPKTPAKTAPTEAAVGAEVIDGSSSSTAYRSLPPVMKTTLTKVLQSNSKPPNQSRLASSALQQYIRRLLGMSRASIDQLELSSVSTVPTPSSSIINVSSNIMPMTNEETIEDQHIDKLTSFINDNHSFIADLEKSLKEITLSDNEASNLKAVETAWMHNLAKQETEMKKLKQDKQRLHAVVKEQARALAKDSKPFTIRPILKKPVSPKKVQVIVADNHRDSVSSEVTKTSLPIGSAHEQYEATAENCNRRIADLNEMIVKVRKEKRRLLESTYSSIGSTVSDRCQNSTEYLEVGYKLQTEHSNNTSKTTSEPISLPEDRRDQAIASMLSESKQIGFSRDSGLGGISRPLTASDVGAISPEVRQDPKVLNADQPKSVQSIKETEFHISRKPPSSLNRFGVQIDQLELGHELSTITECDTPIATSRLNTSLTDPNASSKPNLSNATKAAQMKQLLEMSQETRQKLRITHFQSPPRDNISDATNLDMTTEKTLLNIRPFPSHKSYAEGVSGMLDTISILGTDNESAATQKQLEITALRPFPPHNEFAKETTGLCTSASIAAAMDDDATFPDIEAELRKRNLLQHFTDDAVDENTPGPIPTKTPTQHAPLSTSSSDDLVQEMQKLGLNWASSMIKKNKVATHAMTSSSSSNDELPKPSSLGTATPTPKDGHVKSFLGKSSSENESGGKPLNLKEFLTRELLKRSNSFSSSSSVHDESTLASQFLRSLLGSSNSDSASAQQAVSKTHLTERLRTSTPVKDMRTATPGPIGTTLPDVSSRSKSSPTTQNLFSGESGLSSVRGNSLSSSGKEISSNSNRGGAGK